MIQKLLPFSLLFFIALPMIVIGQKYEVNGSQLIVKDTTYYNFKSVNYIGGELKRIDNQILDLKNEIKKNQSKNVDTETTSFSANSEKLRSLENSIASIKKDISAKSRIKPSKSSSNGTSSYWWLPWLGVLGLGGIFYTLFRNVKKSILIQPKDYSSEITSLKSDIAQKREEMLAYVDEARKEIMTAVDNLSTDVNIRISDLEQSLNDKTEDLDNKKVSRASLGDLLIRLGENIKE